MDRDKKEKEYRVVVWRKDWHCNLPATRMEKDGAIVTVYHGDEFVGQFDLGYVDALYKTEVNQPWTT
jgi:hypothetical protein